MPVNLPQPLFVPGGGNQRSVQEQALLTLLGQLPSVGMDIFQNVQNRPVREAQLEQTKQATQTSKASEENIRNQQDLRQREFDQKQADAAAQADLIRQARETSRRILSNDPSNGQQLLQAYDLLWSMDQSGFDTSLIQPFIDSQLPPSEKEKLELERSRAELAGITTEAEADAYATTKLGALGILPPDAPPLPGAAKTLQTILQARDGEAITWSKEGLDYITSRIGESLGGTGNFVIGPDGQLSLGNQANAVSVEQAVTEWRTVLERYAPEDVRERELQRLDSRSWQRELSKELAVQQVSQTLQLTPAMPEENIRRTLQSGYTDDEITEILRTAKFRNRGPRR